jgi:DNA-directed RNA polymerase|tara:strand:+ start:941 stop:1132 length:192 start_codon:yes stop_codon:yes gene_type:complete
MAYKRKTKKKPIKKKALTKRQQASMTRHSKHHTPKHMKYMKNLMMKGSTFTAAHKKAQKAVGK